MNQEQNESSDLIDILYKSKRSMNLEDVFHPILQVYIAKIPIKSRS